MEHVGESSDASENETDKSREFGHGTNVKRQQFNTKQRMDMYAFCVLELELHGGKVLVKKPSNEPKVLTKSKMVQTNQRLYRTEKDFKKTNQLQVIRPKAGQNQYYQYHQKQIQLQQLQQINRLHQQQQQPLQPQQPHVTRVILLKRLPTTAPNNGNSNNKQDNVQNQPQEENEEQFTYEPTTDGIGDHQYSKKIEDLNVKDSTAKDNNIAGDNGKANDTIDISADAKKGIDEYVESVKEAISKADSTNTNDNLKIDTEVNMDVDTNKDTNTNADPNPLAVAIPENPTGNTSNDTGNNTSDNMTNVTINNASNNTFKTMIPPKPGTRTKTGRKPRRRSASPESGYTYLEPKALWAQQAWAGRKCYSDVQKTQVLTSWMLRNVQQRFAHYYPESAIPSRTTIKHVFQKCISLGTVDNIKNYRKCTKIVDRDEIEQLLLENPNFSLRQLAQKLNVSTGTVSRRCKALGLVPDSVTLKHQQLATAKRQKQIQALQQEIGFCHIPPKPTPTRTRKRKPKDNAAEPSTSSGPSTSNSPYKYYQQPTGAACSGSRYDPKV